MDDLDHSIHIAEYDWSSFYDDSEECNLDQASLAFPDDSDLSDSENSRNSNTGQQETNRRADSNKAEESCTGDVQLLEQLFQGDATCMKQGEISVSCPERNAVSTEPAHKETAQGIVFESNDSSTNTPQTDPLNNFNSAGRRILSKDGAAQMMSDLKSNKKPDLLFCKQAAASVNEQDATGRAEKERWFVTVNDNLGRQRGRATPTKKKLKQKKTGEGVNVRNSEIKKEQEQSRDIHMNQNRESGDLLEEQIISRMVAAVNGDKWESGSSGDTSYDSFSPSPTVMECLHCSERHDGAELTSNSSLDSESYLSAAESLEEVQHPLQESLIKHSPPQRPLSPTSDSFTPSCDAAAAKTPGPVFTLSSAEMADENFTSGNDTCSETHPPPLLCDGSQEDQLSPLPVPDFNQIPCSAADSPETFAKASGQAQPVYAISAFWDEVEKLTINDILQIRMGRSCRLTEDTVKHNASILPTDPVDALDNTMMNSSDTADSDYFTVEETKGDRSVCEFSTSDFEDESWQSVCLSKNSSPDVQNKTQQSDSSFLLDEDGSTDSEGRETPVAVDQCFDYQDIQSLISCPRRITKSRSMYNVQTINTEDLTPLPSVSIDERDLSLSRHQSSEAFLSHISVQDYKISFPEVFEYFFTEYDDKTESQFLTLHDSEVIIVYPVFHAPLCTFRVDPSTSPLQCSIEKPIPIFSCSRPTVRDLTFSNAQVFLCTDCEEVGNVSPMKIMSHSFIQASSHESSGAAGVVGSTCWKSFQSLRKIRFPNKGSICCSESGAWIFPLEAKEILIGRQNQAVTLQSGEKMCLDFAQEFRELEEQRKISETIWRTKREGIFSTVKQSDMCLVCIAFASWVLRSSNPEAADAWKAALLANVSALSAIQYLRHSMKRKNPPINDL